MLDRLLSRVLYWFCLMMMSLEMDGPSVDHDITTSSYSTWTDSSVSSLPRRAVDLEDPFGEPSSSHAFDHVSDVDVASETTEVVHEEFTDDEVDEDDRDPFDETSSLEGGLSPTPRRGHRVDDSRSSLLSIYDSAHESTDDVEGDDSLTDASRRPNRQLFTRPASEKLRKDVQVCLLSIHRADG